MNNNEILRKYDTRSREKVINRNRLLDDTDGDIRKKGL